VPRGVVGELSSGRETMPALRGDSVKCFGGEEGNSCFKGGDIGGPGCYI